MTIDARALIGAGPYLDPVLRLRGAGAAVGSALPLAGGWARFDRVRLRQRGPRDQTAWSAPVGVEAAADDALNALTAPRPDMLGLALNRPRIMGVLNVTPDSFSDGGRHLDPSRAVEAGLAMVEAGADLLDIGGESTRPGAAPVERDVERARVMPVIRGLAAAGLRAPISIDTRKASIAREAFDLGARLFNDVSGLEHDSESTAAAAELTTSGEGWVCVMHAQGDPRVMQRDPRYDDVLLDVFDALAERLVQAQAAGVRTDRILLDPGIGFGKTAAHNLELLRGLAVLHGLGAPILLGASRKRFIGALSGEAEAARRGPGSVAAALWGVARGAQVLRVHDVAETAQALRVYEGLVDDAGAGAAE